MDKNPNMEEGRVPRLLEVRLRLPDGTRTSERKIWNTSLGGVFIEMDTPLPFGSDLDLEFVFPRDIRNVRCDGFVVWSRNTSPEKAAGKSGVCVRLANIEIADMRRLATAVGRDLTE